MNSEPMEKKIKKPKIYVIIFGALNSTGLVQKKIISFPSLFKQGSILIIPSFFQVQYTLS